MTPEETEQMKVIFKRLHEQIKREWLERQILRNLIIESGWMPAKELDSGIADSCKLPENIRLLNENFAGSEQSLAEIGLEHLSSILDKLFPPTDPNES